MTALVWTETTTKNDPGRRSEEVSFQVGCCALWSHTSGRQTSWSLVCLNRERHWEKGFSLRPSSVIVEQLVAEHMAECPYQKADG